MHQSKLVFQNSNQYFVLQVLPDTEARNMIASRHKPEGDTDPVGPGCSSTAWLVSSFYLKRMAVLSVLPGFCPTDISYKKEKG